MSKLNKEITLEEIKKEEIKEIIDFLIHICNNQEYKNGFIESYKTYIKKKKCFNDGISYLKQFIRVHIDPKYKYYDYLLLDGILDKYIHEENLLEEGLKERLKNIIMTLLRQISHMNYTSVLFFEYKKKYNEPHFINNFELFIYNFVSYFCIHKEYLITELLKELLKDLWEEELRQIGRVNASEKSLRSSKKLASITTRSKHTRARGGNPKYKSTGITVRILYKKRKYKRTIYVKDTKKTKYCKIDGEYILLSKMKLI